MFQTRPRSYFALAAKLDSVSDTQVVLVLKMWRSHGEQLRLVTVRDQERLLENVQPQQQLKAQNWRGYAKKLRFGTIRESMSGYWWKLNSAVAEVCSILDMPIPWPSRTAEAMEWSLSKLRRQAACAAEGRAETVTPAFCRNPEGVSKPQILDIQLFKLSAFGFALSGLWFALVLPS